MGAADLIIAAALASIAAAFLAAWVARKREYVLVGASLAAAVLLVELGVRTFRPQFNAPGLFRPDTTLGWTFRPGVERDITYPRGSGHTARINHLGYRDNDFAMPDAELPRVAVAGDSFVSNLAVPGDSVFTEHLERVLAVALGRPVAVDNLGVNGYSALQSLMGLGRYFDRFRPELIVFVVYPQNDYFENEDLAWHQWTYRRPRLKREGPESASAIWTVEAVDPAAVRPPPLRARSHAWTFVASRLNRLLQQWGHSESADPARLPPDLRISRRTPGVAHLDRLAAMSHVLRSVVEEAVEHGADLLIVAAPSAEVVVDDYWARMLAASDTPADAFDRTLSTRSIQTLADSIDVPVLDLYPSLSALVAPGEAVGLYHPYERHWTTSGNRVVAHQLLPTIRSILEARAENVRRAEPREGPLVDAPRGKSRTTSSL